MYLKTTFERFSRRMKLKLNAQKCSNPLANNTVGVTRQFQRGVVLVVKKKPITKIGLRNI